MIYLIRHGETALNAARVLQPPETPLSERGLAQAERLGERLRQVGIAHVLCSDLPRARMTAAPIVRGSQVAIEYTDLLQERNFGALRGRPYAELSADIFNPEFVPPEGEGWVDFDARASRAWAKVVELAAKVSGNLAVVTHGLLCGSVARRHLSLAEGESLPSRWGNTSVTICDRASPHQVRLLNCVAHLQGDDDTKAPSGL